MFSIGLLLLTCLSAASPTGVSVLFPELKRYYYVVKSNVSTGTVDGDTYWTLEGRLCVHVYDNYTKARLQLDELNTSVYSQEAGFSSYQFEDDAKHLELPWEVEYEEEDGIIKALYVGEEPLWSTNIKRALAVNFQIKTGTPVNYNEPCLYETCTMVYTAKGSVVKKYTTLTSKSLLGGVSWSSVPGSTDYTVHVLDNTATEERTYEFSAAGLNDLVMTSTVQYRVDAHILAVNAELSMYFDSDAPGISVDKLNVTKTSVHYTKDFKDPTNGLKPSLQSELRNRTYEILLKIATKGIDADNIIRNGSYIHSLHFVELLDTVSRLSYHTLTKLFEDLVLGTSYDLETARNIFLEVLPHARSDACARFIKHLVLEEKSKLEDATIISMIRKLPFNVANLSQNLLEELETFTKLSLDFPQTIRHAGILSFAVLASKTAEAGRTKQDYFDNIVVKYFKMYNDCPQYLDRMVWLQGLCSLGNTAESYIRTIYRDKTRNRRERLWASLACAQETRGPDELRRRITVLESYLPILTDESEHIQLRVAALHSILSEDIGANDFMFIHNYITSSNCNTLKRFWYSTVKSLESNKYFSEYKSASYYVPFVSKHVRNPDSTYWATNNYIVSSEEKLGAWVQMMSVGGEPIPTFAGLRVSTPGRRPYQAAIYMITEGVSSNLFNKFFNNKSKKGHVEQLVHIMEKLKVNLKSQEAVHIDIVMKINDKTVFATHVNQTRFESWNGHEVTKSIMEFLRFGSHINQQIVYYPVQLDVHEHTALGTPIRFQSSVVAFTSVRGNLTAPPDPKDDLDWENDLHIRYQGTSVTSLSTFAPLLSSEHVVRLQRSFVAHLPIKFNVTVQQVTKSTALTWLNPFAQRAGMALHSRVQLEVNSPRGRDAHTLAPANTDISDDDGIFFDCERKISGGEVLEKYLLSKFVSYDILPTHQSILNNIERFMSSPACGVIVPPSRPALGDDEVIRVRLSLGDVSWTRVDRIELNFGFLLSYYSLVEQNEGVYLKMDSSTMMRSDGRNVSIDWRLYVEQPHAGPADRFLKLCFSLQDISHASETQDIAAHPASYEGRTTIAYSATPEFRDCSHLDGSRVTMFYTGTPQNVNGDIERLVRVNILGEKLHRFGVLSHTELGDTPVSQLLGSFDKDTINTTAVIKEKHGMASISVNAGAEIQFEVENFGWMMDSLTSMQLMKRFGIYRECRLQTSTIQTLSGTVEQLQPLACTERLVLGDCSEIPSFAILRDKNGELVIHTAAEGDAKNSSLHHVPHEERYLSPASGVMVYKMRAETVVLVPSPYLPHLCGECVNNDNNKYCYNQ